MEREKQCQLLEGTAGFLAQLLLFVFVLASLLYKRSLEFPKRGLRIWAMDVSKQGFSAGAGHLCNMVIAIIASNSITSRQTSECSWYFVVYTIDTTLGVSLTVLLHNFILRGARYHQQNRYEKLGPNPTPGGMWDHTVEKRWFDHIAMCGNYGNPPSCRPWIWQMGEWTLVSVIARVVCGLLVVSFGHFGLVEAAAFLDSLFGERQGLLLMFVMVMCPVLMNIAQAWVQDAILRWKKSEHKDMSLKQFVGTDLEGMDILCDDWSDSSDVRGNDEQRDLPL